MPLQAFEALLESKVLRHVFSLWQGARTDALVPTWAAIEAMGDPLVQEFSWAWRLDPATDTLISFLMGPRPREMYGIDAVGMNLQQFYVGPMHATVNTNMRVVIDTPMLHRAAGMIYWREGRADLGERMLLPIRFASDDKPDAVLGTTVFDYTMLGAIAPAAPPAQELDLIPLYS